MYLLIIHLALSSDNLITTTELQLQAESLAKTTGSGHLPKKEITCGNHGQRKDLQSFSGKFKQTLGSEKKITQYYFSHTHFQINLLLDYRAYIFLLGIF